MRGPNPYTTRIPRCNVAALRTQIPYEKTSRIGEVMPVYRVLVPLPLLLGERQSRVLLVGILCTEWRSVLSVSRRDGGSHRDHPSDCPRKRENWDRPVNSNQSDRLRERGKNSRQGQPRLLPTRLRTLPIPSSPCHPQGMTPDCCLDLALHIILNSSMGLRPPRTRNPVLTLTKIVPVCR